MITFSYQSWIDKIQFSNCIICWSLDHSSEILICSALDSPSMQWEVTGLITWIQECEVPSQELAMLLVLFTLVTWKLHCRYRKRETSDFPVIIFLESVFSRRLLFKMGLGILKLLVYIPLPLFVSVLIFRFFSILPCFWDIYFHLCVYYE